MKRKSIKVNRLSPNEEAQLIREELQRRRKLRLQQVREQERHIALQVRREVQERRERELRCLATSLRDEWQRQRGEKIQNLEKLYKESLRDVGQGHRDARQNEPNQEALALKKEENESRAAERHQKALRNLITQRQAESELRNRHVDARRKALMVEKERAAKIASLPHSGPDPIENVAIQTPLQSKVSNMEHYSVTHYHIPEAAVDRETDTVQPDAQEAAALEVRRIEDLEKEETRDRQEQLERARLRGHHALRKEKDIQNNARMLRELERLQQAEMQRRRHVVNSMPAQIFQPLYRHEHLRAEQQRELEIAFQDLCTEDKDIRDDLVLQFVSKPLPPPVPSTNTDNRPESDLDLDVTLEPKETPCEEEEQDSGQEPVASQSQFMRSTAPAEGSGRTALRRLLDRIRTQRDQWSMEESSEGQGKVRVENVNYESRPPGNLEWEHASSLEEGTVETLMENHSKMSEDSILAGPQLHPDGQICEVETRMTELRRQQQEQLTLLQELEEKRQSLELQLEEAQLCRQRLQDALQVPSGNCGLQESPPQSQETGPEPSPEVNVSAPLPDSTHIGRLQQYQQRLLKQNRLHKKTIDDAYRNLEEYKRTLKMRYTPVTMTAAPVPPTSVHEETICALPSIPHRTPSSAVPLFSNHDPASTCPISTETLMKQSHNNIDHTDPALFIRSSPPSPSPALTTIPNTHVTAPPDPISVPLTIAHSVCEDGSATDGPSRLQDVPLLPPAVFLEYLRSRRSRDLPTPLAPISQQISGDPDVEVQNNNLCRNTETEPVRDRIRKQRDALLTLIRAQHVEALSASTGTHDVFDVPVKEITSNEPTRTSTLNQSHAHTLQTPVFESSEHSSHDMASGVRVNPPVSCPRRTLQMLLHGFEQHKLSTIEEVDTPVNVTMDAGAELESMESQSAECSYHSNFCSLSWTPPTTGSGSSQGQSLASEIQSSEESTCRPSKLSWKEMLQLESTASNAGTDSTEQQQIEEQELVLPYDGGTGAPDFLSSTTLSTGSYVSSEQEPNLNITNPSLCTTEFPEKSGASFTHSGSLCGLTLPETSDSSRCSSSLQYIIDKYTKELDKSLRSVHTATADVSVVSAQEHLDTALSFWAEPDTDPGALVAPKPPTLPLQCDLEDSRSLNTTLQDTFQSLSPEITNNTMTECSTTLQLPFNPPAEDSNTNASDLSQQVSATEERSPSASACVPQWEWTLGNKSEFGSLEALVSHEVQERSKLQDSGEESISTLHVTSFGEAETSSSTDRSEEVEHRRELHSCPHAYAKNREKAKEFRMKTLEKLRPKQR